ncbi:MAG: hypothetical protein JSV49_06615 [Thermoplasmata archaeon]|nr:MAG: hypothetical protein JSV49_06615 [Thermoplasmata archaeon]
MHLNITKQLFAIVIILILTMQLQSISVSGLADAAPTQREGVEDAQTTQQSRESNLNDVKLYFHRNNIMNTNRPSNPATAYHGLGVDPSLEFNLNPSLYYDLRTIGKSKVGTQEALWLDLTVDYTVLGGNSADMTVRIFDDTNLIAENTFTFEGSSTEDTFLIPFTGTKTEHTFSAGSVIKINFTGDVPAGASVRISYDSSNSPHGFLYLTCDQVGDMSLGPFHHDGTTGDFEPNTPDNRVIKFEGEIEDAFGGYDISQVYLNCPTLTEFPDDAEATIQAVDSTAEYYYNWSYPYGLAPAQYTVEATIVDNSDNIYYDSTTFTISSYGVHIRIVEPEKSAEKGKSVVFDIEVTNTGGVYDTITLVASPALSWQTQFENNPIGLNANQTGDVTLTVSIPGTAEDNQHNSITITASSTNDGSKQMSGEAIATALAATGFTFELLSDAQQEIEDSETATYNFRLVNTGQQTETFIIAASYTTTSGWQVLLQGGTPMPPGSGEKIRHQTTLQTNGQLNIVLSVSANSPSTNSLDVTLKVTPTNDTGKAQQKTTTTKLLVQGGILMTVASVDDQTSQVVDPAASTPSYKPLMYTVNVENTGMEVTVSFDITMPSGASKWTVEKPSSITLDQDDDQDVSFSVTPNSDAQATEGDGHTITLRATPEGGSSVDSVKTTVLAKVAQFYKFEAEVESEKTVSGSNQDAEYQITVTNRGNGADTISIILYDNEWDYEWSSAPPSAEKLGNILKVTLDPNAFATIILTFTSPSDTRNGDKDEPLLVIQSEKFDTTQERTYKKFTLTTTVEKSSGEAFRDAMGKLWILIVLVIAVIIISVFIKVKLKEKGTD